MALRDRLRKLQKRAEEGAVIIHLRDGSRRIFEEMEVFKVMFLTQMDLLGGTAHSSEVLDAVRAATPESRAAFEERFGKINMEARVIAPKHQGGWVEHFELLEDGTVKRTFIEVGTQEAERIHLEAQGRGLTGLPYGGTHGSQQ